jgi:preprotein translocase subunit SecF
MMHLNIIKNRSIWLSMSAVLVSLSILALILWGLKFGIDFTGGSLMELQFSSGQPSVASVRDQLANENISSLIIQPTDDSIILRFKESEETAHQAVLSRLSFLPEAEKGIEELRFESIGPSIGQELRSKSLWLMFLS